MKCFFLLVLQRESPCKKRVCNDDYEELFAEFRKTVARAEAAEKSYGDLLFQCEKKETTYETVQIDNANLRKENTRLQSILSEINRLSNGSRFVDVAETSGRGSISISEEAAESLASRPLTGTLAFMKVIFIVSVLNVINSKKKKKN